MNHKRVFINFLSNSLLSSAYLIVFQAYCFAEQEITFTQHIAPILFENCTSCHRPNQAAPFSLRTYEEARRRSRTIARVVNDRYMPPWLPKDGDIPFKGERHLSDGQISLILKWVEQGCKEGEPKHLPPLPEFPDEKWNLGEPDLVLQMDKPFPLPAEGPDIYKDFKMPYQVNGKKYVKGVAFLPGNLSVVHHSLVYQQSKGKGKQFIGGWVPGAKGMFLPEGLSYEFDPHGEVSLSTHFHLSGKPETETSTVGLYFDDKPPTREMSAIMLPPHFGIFSGFDILPGAKKTEVIDKFVLPVDVEAFWVYGHAHYLGKSLSLTAKLPDGKSLKLLNIPDWDFNWQETYEFKEHVFLPQGTQLISHVTWDNSPENPDNPYDPPKRVRWGKESFDEMAELDLFVILKNKEDKKKLDKAYKQHIAKPWMDRMASKETLSFAEKVIAKAMDKFDLDGDGVLNKSETQLAQNYLKKTLSIK